jgi:hypothetical protein
VAVTFAEAAVIAPHRRLNQAHRIVGRALEWVLAKGNRLRLEGAAEVSP